MNVVAFQRGLACVLWFLKVGSELSGSRASSIPALGVEAAGSGDSCWYSRHSSCSLERVRWFLTEETKNEEGEVGEGGRNASEGVGKCR